MLLQNNQGIKLSGFFKGIVVEHCANGKCKVFIPGVYPDYLESNPDALPEAEQITPLFGGSNKGNGIFSYPNIGSIVLCGFYNEDQNFPFFFGSILGGDLPKEEYRDIRPDTELSSIQSGDDSRIHKINVDQASIKFWESGKIQIKTASDRKSKPDKSCVIDIDNDGNINIKTSTQIRLDSPDIMIDTERMTINTQAFKMNVGSGTELETSTLNVKAKSEIDINTATKIEVVSKSDNTISPVINLDAVSGANKFGGSGSIAIKGLQHAPMFL